MLRRTKEGSPWSPWSLLLRPWANRTGILSGISSYKNLSPRSMVALLALCAGLVALGGKVIDSLPSPRYL
jgi:hypothetical protein